MRIAIHPLDIVTVSGCRYRGYNWNVHRSHCSGQSSRDSEGVDGHRDGDCGANNHRDCRPKEVRGLEMSADEEILPGAAEIVSVQEGGCHRDGNQDDLDGDDDEKSAVVGHPELRKTRILPSVLWRE